MKQLYLSFLLMLLPVATFADAVEIDGIYYNLFNDTQTAEVTNNPNSYSGEIIIPGSIQYSGTTYTVTSLKEKAFQYCNELTAITLSDGIKTIGKFAFAWCHNLTSIVIPESVLSIGEAAFQSCTKLESIVIPEGLFFIGVAAFNNCSSLEEINFPSSLVYPGNTLTYNCISLTAIKSKIKRPSNLEADFPKSVFENAILTVPKGTKSAYQSCEGWKEFVNIVEDENTTITDDDIRTIHVSEAGTLANYITDTDKYNIYDLTLTGELNGTDLRLLRDMAGHDHKDNFTAGKLRKLDLTNAKIVCGGERYLDTDTLHEGAYYSANYSYGKNAFRFSVEEDNNVPKYVFARTMLEKLSFPNNAAEIMDYACLGCYYLECISIPNSVATIGKGAFINCRSLATITIPNSVTSIGEYAFSQNNGALTSIFSEITSPFEIKNNVFDNYSIPILTVPVGTKAEYQATNGWNNFTNIGEVGSGETFPKRSFRVAKAGTLSHYISESDKYTIEDLTLTGELNGTDFRLIRDMAGYDYQGKNTNGQLKVLDLSGAKIVAGGDMYLDATRIKNTMDSGLGGNFHFSIEESDIFPKYILHGCNLQAITLPKTTTKVGISALGACFELESVIIPGNATQIEYYNAFGNCYSLENIEVSSNNSYLSSEDGILFNKDKTTLIIYPRGKQASSYTIPNTVTELNQHVFEGASSLTSIILPDGLQTIGLYAFASCSLLSSISLPSSVNSLHVTAFERCQNLGSIIVDEANESYSSLDGVLFDKDRETLICYPMGKENEEYTVPNGVKNIDSQSFQLCNILHKVTIANTVTSIGEWAFGNNTGLTTVIIPRSVTSIGNFAFYSCKNLTNITSYNADPFDIEKEVFWGPQSSNPAQSVDIYGHATLFVPLGCKAKYEAANGWKNFTNIEEITLTPMENQDEIDYSEGGNVDENTNLEGTIIDNVYYNISQDNGGFDSEDKCIVVNKSMSDDEIESVFGKDLQSDEVKESFAGMVIEVPAGKGCLTINAQTVGGMTLKVKIGSADPLTLEFDSKMKVNVPYNVIEPTYVYIYAGASTAASRSRTGNANEKSLRIYGLSIDAKTFTKGDVNNDNSKDIADAVCVVNHIVGKPTQEFIAAAADVNHDGAVDIADAVYIVNYVVGKIETLARQRETTYSPEPE